MFPNTDFSHDISSGPRGIEFAPAFASDGAVFDYGAVRELRAIIVKHDQP
jgi:hypothetical protein